MGLFLVSSDHTKVIISMMNVVLILCPLIATMFGVMHYYNSRDFIELLLSQPVRRQTIFMAQYLGLAISLSLSLVVGIGLPFLFYGIFGSPDIFNFSILILIGIFLSFIFSGIAYLVALKNENRIRGFGLAILLWLFFGILYDGIFLLLILWLSDYPLENFALAATVLNPIDLSRILILLKLDISAIMGYTGAVFQKFLGTGIGMAISLGSLLLWVMIPVWGIRMISSKKDF
jgi:Cu-processing system permease protein